MGIARTAGDGEFAVLYSPGQLASSAVPVVVVDAVLALVAPYAIRFFSLGWAVGAFLAAMAAPRTGQAEYILPLGCPRPRCWRRGALGEVARGALVPLTLAAQALPLARLEV
ncbi:MAG: hypothetical protein M3N52_05545 [Actinomycetota bacterium]|nr:hypothetical protein [Actinomycetota bacterium]